MRVAVVAPRYGPQIIGGSEAAMRMIAERLVSELGWTVEALCTCAADYRTWENELPAGESSLNGVRVRRFESAHGRTGEFDMLTDRVLGAPSQASLAASERWIDLQGPRCPELVIALGDCDADLVVFSPYLYYPTVRGIEVVARRSILHPAAHDEPQVYLPVFRDTFLAAGAFVFNGAWERRFVDELFGIGSRPALTLGLGVDDPGDERAVPGEIEEDAFGIGGRPYLVCVGRVEPGKGTSELARMFAAYKRSHPGPLALVLAGPVVAAPAPHPDVILTGQVDEAVKWSLLDGALGLLAPSPFESFAIVLMEAWTRRLPVLVNARCEATREQCELSGGGLAYGSFDEFAAAVTRILGDDSLRLELGHRGREYVDRNFRWPALIRRWGRFAEQVAERAAPIGTTRKDAP